MRSRVGFVAATCSLVAVFAASATPIPLYELYRRADGLSHLDLALTTVAYLVTVMAGLLVLGRLSNHLGRRPVALTALGVTAAGTLLLLRVHGVAPLIAGRVLQGVGCALAASAVSAFVIDTAPASPPWLASAVTTGAPMVGLTLGALGSGALAEYGPSPRTLVYLVTTGLLALCAALVLAAAETVRRTAGAVASLRPQARVPATARPLLPAASATFLATWALGGFYQAFGPSVAADQLGTTSTMVAAAVFASLAGPSAIGAVLAGRVTPATGQRLGMVAFFLAVGVILLSLRLGAVGGVPGRQRRRRRRAGHDVRREPARAAERRGPGRTRGHDVGHLPALLQRSGDPGTDRRAAVAQHRPVRHRARLRRARGDRLRRDPRHRPRPSYGARTAPHRRPHPHPGASTAR